MIKYFYDTCGLLNKDKLDFDESFVISSVTLLELESIKISGTKDEFIKYKAREVIRQLNANENKYEVIIDNSSICDILLAFNLPITNDNKIIASCFKYNKEIEKVVFCTDDLCCKVIAKNIFNLNVQSSNDNKLEEEYTGYKTVTMTDEEMEYFYSNLSDNTFDCLVNEYLIIRNSGNLVVDKRKWNGSTFIPLSYKQINNDFTGKIKPRNLEQELAFDMMQDSDSIIKVLSGRMGSGKDYIMISTALQLIKNQKYKKILWIRNNIEVKGSNPIGFLPSDKKSKLLPFAMIMADHVGGLDGLELLMTQGKIEIDHLGFIRGRDLKDTIVMCSEAENMSTEHIQLLVGRIGEGSTLWINGDCKQIDSKVFEINNGLKSAIDKLKNNKLFGFVKLQQCERSETAKLADLLN